MNSDSQEVFQTSEKAVQDLQAELQTHPENLKWTEGDITFERANPPVPGKLYSTTFNGQNVVVTVALTEPILCEGMITKQDGAGLAVHIPVPVARMAYANSIRKQFAPSP